MEKDKENKTEETKVKDKVSSSKRIKAQEGTESSINHVEDLDFVEKYGVELSVMGASVGMHDGTNISAERKFMNLAQSIPHSHEVIYDPKEKKSKKKSVQDESGR